MRFFNKLSSTTKFVEKGTSTHHRLVWRTAHADADTQSGLLRPTARLGMPPKKKSALVGTVFCISGSLSVPKKNMTDMLTGAGAEVSSSLTAKVTHVLTTDADVAKQTSKVVTAEQKGLPVVGESFVSACLKAGKQVNLAPHLLVAGVAAGKKAAGKKAAGKKAPPGPKKAITKKPPKKVTAKKSAKASAAAADAAGGATAPEPIETGKTVGASVATDDDTGQYLEYQLSQMDLAKNIDKFYIAQVLDCGPSSFYCVQHWGRTGTKGQVTDHVFSIIDY